MNIFRLLDFKPKMKDFAAEFLRGLANAGLTGWTLGPEGDSLIHPRGEVFNLPNLHRRYVNTRRADRSAILRSYIEIAANTSREIPRDWAGAAPGIYAAVRSRYSLAGLEIIHRATSNPWPASVIWPLFGDLHVSLVYDFGAHVSNVKEETMQTWGQPIALVRQRAMDNLSALPAPAWDSIGAGVYQLKSHASYEESFLLVDHAVDALPFKNSLVAIAPNRGVLLATDGKSEASLAAMLEEALHCLQNKPWPMSATLCTRANGEWHEFLPAGDAAKHAHKLHTINVGAFYEDQKKSLEKHHESIGHDVFVASFGVIEKDGEYVSWCTWPEGVLTLLPKTDVIALVRPEQKAVPERLMMDWDIVARIAGHRMKPTTENPTRFLLDTFPNAGEWAALLAEAARSPGKLE
ncbi:MAG: hypothetical protein ABIR10_12290 [Dokdonella sp.]